MIGGVFVAAALAATFVVSQLPREGEPGPPDAGEAPEARAPAPTPAVERVAAPDDGLLEVRVTSGGAPLPGAEVALYLEVPGLPGAAYGWQRAATGRTGADGVARVPAWPGPYLAAVRAPGLAPAHVEVVRPEGQEVTPLEVALAPPATLAGKVLGPDGRPAAARISVVPLLADAGRAPVEETASAGAGPDGSFRVEGLGPGTFALRAEAPGLHAVLLARVAMPRARPLELRLERLAAVRGEVLASDGRPAAGAVVRALSSHHAVEAVAGADGRFALEVPAGAHHVVTALGDEAAALPGPTTLAPGGALDGVALRLGPAAALEGAVVRRDGAPVPGAAVAVRRHGAGVVSERAAADADGRFRIEGLAPGAWDVLVSAAGLGPGRAEGVTLAPGQRFPLRVPLAGLGAVEGRVTDPRGEPLANARVRVVSRGDGLAGVVPREARTDFDGRYRLAGLEAGRAELVAHELASALGASRTVRVAEARAAWADFVLAPPGVLAGRATAGGASPPPGTAVVATPLRGGSGAPQAARAATDASGNFRLVVPAGEYRVHAAPAEADGADLRVAPAFARVQPGGTAMLKLEVAPATEEGGLEILVLEPGGAPSSGAVVTLGRPDDAKVALALRAGEDGRVRLAREMGLAGRAATVRARNGGRAGAFEGTLPEAGAVAVTLSPGAALQGTVRGAGARGFTLEVASQPGPDGWRVLDVHRFAGERFELGDLPPEPLRITVRAEDGRRGEAEVRLSPGEARTLELALGSAAR